MYASAFLGYNGFHIRTALSTLDHRCTEAMINWFASHADPTRFEILASASQDYAVAFPDGLRPFFNYSHPLMPSRLLLSQRVMQWIKSSGLNPPVEPCLIVHEPLIFPLLPRQHQPPAWRPNPHSWRHTSTSNIPLSFPAFDESQICWDISATENVQFHHMESNVQQIPKDAYADQAQLLALNLLRLEFLVLNGSYSMDRPIAWVYRRMLTIIDNEERITGQPFLAYVHDLDPTALRTLHPVQHADVYENTSKGIGELSHEILHHAFRAVTGRYNVKGPISQQRSLAVYSTRFADILNRESATPCVAYVYHATRLDFTCNRGNANIEPHAM
ncbi:uncharacterized protein BXZ73DRAFT_105942 [Epithele typhae]|uniref:uncharacterized protein n=1 Tax=Epithele typhae TaxID=378194 RepID=UPI002008B037|nr:uncharacterized protein BXZ73DRAFT_105942 [Epithele typhae]KAH9916090.1 hypothetical protein BXZ73DRAFT_105942 [Epithele typhae]